jgi:hypothetical protein
MIRLALLTSVFACLCKPAVAGSPTIRELRPWGAQRGQTVTLTIVGDQLEAGSETFSAVPGKLQEQPGGNAGQLMFQLEIKPDAPVGVYPVRVRTSGGLSNVLLFSVGDLPEISETEPNDVLPVMNSIAAPTSPSVPVLTLPATINGSAVGTDQDVFRFSAKRGERIVMEVEAQRIGSSLDPALHVFNASGRELTFADDTPGLGLDCRVDLSVPEDGDYFVAVHDSKYAGVGPGQYRLKIGQFAYAETAFPLGGQRGGTFDLTLFGGTLSEPIRTKVAANAAGDSNRLFVPVPIPGPQVQLPLRFVLGDAPELLEPDSDVIDQRVFKDAGVMNGRIAKAGEVDRYKFPAAPGQTWIFEIDAANQGSPLDALLTVSGPQGNVLATADDGNGLDPRVQITVPAGVDHVLLAVEDLHRRGGPMFAYRLKARMPRTDFALQVMPAGQQPAPGAPPAPAPLGPQAINIPRGGITVAQVNVARDGYNGPIQLEIPETAVGITAEDGLIPAGVNTGLIVLSAAADLPLHAFDLEIRGQGGVATKPMVRPAVSTQSSLGMAEAFVARVPAAICERAPVEFSVAERSIKVVHGHNRELKIKAQRGPNATEPINVNGLGLPAFVVAGTSGTIAKDSSEITLMLNCSPENPVVGQFTMQLQATTQTDGRQELIQIPPVKVDLVRPFAIELLNQNITITPGARMRIAAVLRRESPFDGSVRVGPAGSLPQHISLITVDVPKGDALALLELEVGDLATPAELDIPIRASTDMEGRKRDKDYVIPDTPMKVKITPKVAPSDKP